MITSILGRCSNRAPTPAQLEKFHHTSNLVHLGGQCYQYKSSEKMEWPSQDILLPQKWFSYQNWHDFTTK